MDKVTSDSAIVAKERNDAVSQLGKELKEILIINKIWRRRISNNYSPKTVECFNKLLKFHREQHSRI